jgi:hypothetical protein
MRLVRPSSRGEPFARGHGLEVKEGLPPIDRLPYGGVLSKRQPGGEVSTVISSRARLVGVLFKSMADSFFDGELCW